MPTEDFLQFVPSFLSAVASLGAPNKLNAGAAKGVFGKEYDTRKLHIPAGASFFSVELSFAGPPNKLNDAGATTMCDYFILLENQIKRLPAVVSFFSVDGAPKRLNEGTIRTTIGKCGTMIKTVSYQESKTFLVPLL